jgi:hypothetical protein
MTADRHSRIGAFVEHVYKTNYLPTVEKQNSPGGVQSKALQKQRNDLMRVPNKKYLGCLATRINPEDYEYCLHEYDNPNEHYEKSKLVPNINALRETVYSKAVARGDQAAARALQLPDKAKISYLPAGLHSFYENHPDK